MHAESVMLLVDAKQQKLAGTMQRWYDVARTKQAHYTEELESLQQQAEDVDDGAKLLSQKSPAALRLSVVSCCSLEPHCQGIYDCLQHMLHILKGHHLKCKSSQAQSCHMHA